MGIDRLSSLVDLQAIQKMADANYKASGMPIGIIDAFDDSILVGCGWQEICLKFHRANKASLKRCQESDSYILNHLIKEEACHYKCQNGLWDIGIPLIIADHHMATLFLGQFFYDGEVFDEDFFIQQAYEFGYDLDEYLAALHKVPVFKHEKVEYIVEYNKALARFITDLAEGSIQRKTMDKTLHKVEKKYQRLAENAQDMIYRMSVPDGQYEYVSPASFKLFGYKPVEFYDNPLLIKKIIHPDWHGYFEEQWANLLEGDVPPVYEYQAIHKDGTVRWVNQRNTLEKDENGIPFAIEGVATDITERKNAEEELVKSRSQLRILINTIHDLVWLKDLEGVYLGCNKKFERFFGAKESEIIGKTDYDFVDKDLADFFRKHDRKAIETDMPSVNEEWLTFPDDGYHGLFETIKTPMLDPKGKLIGVLGIARDITKRKMAEDALRQNEQRYKSSQRMGLVGNWEYDLVTETFWGSDQAKRIYGFEVDSDRFTTDEVENCIPERERVHQVLVDLIEKNKPYDIEFEIHPIAGPKIRIIRSIAEIIRDKSGAPLKVIGVVQDITNQKKAQKEKEELEEKLRQTQKIESIGRLAGGVAHDFNNMLSIILGNTEIILDDLDSANPVIGNLYEIRKAAERSTSLTRQLLAFARKQTISPKVLDLNETIEGMLKMLRRLIGENIDLSWLPRINLWIIKLDPSQVDQILANLCVNARDAIKDIGKITIETDNVSFDKDYCREHYGYKPGDYVMAAVSDNGCGMDKGIMNNLFEPFFTTKGVGEGTGLGLATVYGIVKQNNGFINVYSEPNKGTTFRIYFPRYTEKDLPVHKPESKKAEARGSETVLLVEDEKAILEMTKMMLERLGYNVLAASNPDEALNIGKSNPEKIDLLITDVVMPGMNGRDLAKEMAKLFPILKCLFMSGYTANVIAHHGVLDYGMQFIQKPFSRQDLAKKIREVLNEDERQACD